VQLENEQRCQQEIEDIKHGLESGSITYDPAKLKFSEEAIEEQKHCVRIADEKVALATQTYDLVSVSSVCRKNPLHQEHWFLLDILEEELERTQINLILSSFSCVEEMETGITNQSLAFPNWGARYNCFSSLLSPFAIPKRYLSKWKI